MRIDWYAVQWLLLTAIWVVGAISSKRAIRHEGAGARIVHESILALAFLLLFAPRLGPLSIRWIPDTPTTNFLGLTLTAAGLAFAIGARFTLGRNWSGTVTIKEDHRLIRRGPYRIVRHPIYSGVLLAMIGTAIGYGRVACLISVPVAFLALWTKSRTEEQFMIEQFGAQYIEYQREVKAIVPALL